MTLPPVLAGKGLTDRGRHLMELARERILLFDGAMGTAIFEMELDDAAFGGIPDCPEMLNLTDAGAAAIATIHRDYFAAGADIVETNTFGGSAVTLAEFELEDRTEEINRRAAEIAREVAAEFTAKEPDKPRFVSGSIGPGTKLPSLGHIDFDTLARGLERQCVGLLEGGVDVIQIETCQDILQIKAGVVGARRAFESTGIRVPIVVQFTVETTGTMLGGTDVTAAFTTFEPYPEIWAFGLNCATGPTHMGPHLQTLSRLTDRALTCLPNAGLPQNVGGQQVYPLGPEELAEAVERFVTDYGLTVVGGCCGTTPAHIRALAERLKDRKPVPREAAFEPSAASLYGAWTLRQQPPPLLVGERLNANGSRKFKKRLLAGDIDGMLDMAKSQMKGGAHLLDVCVAYVGRDEVADMTALLDKLRTVSQLPLVIDSTEVPVIEAALKMIPGRAVVNSINLEDGEAKPREILELCRTYGAAVIALTIDEDGQAYTAERKIAIAERLFKLADEVGLRPQDLIFDALTFTLATGEEEYRKVGIETLNGIKGIKERCPGSLTILGLSNCSFGLNPAARQVLNSVFLDEAVKVGLDQAIVHASKILPLFKVPEEAKQACLDLIFDRRETDDPLMRLVNLYEGKKASGGARKERSEKVEERLEQRIIDGDRKGLDADLDLALESYDPFEIINRFLMDGMKVVGELFGAGKMQLPFVLQSAEVMKAAVKHLEPHMEKTEDSRRGCVVLATVKGDVHDIGKNLVDIILSNNGFEVHNIGIKQPVDAILEKAAEVKADVIGMSGLLVKSTVVMKDNLAEMNRRGVTTPVLLGGAALTRGYVEQDLRELYDGEVAYARDAFDGLRIATMLEERGTIIDVVDSAAKPVAKVKSEEDDASVYEDDGRRPTLSAVEPPTPPFWGAKVVEDPIPVDALYGWINTMTLFRGQWQFRRGSRTPAEQKAYEAETVEPIFREVCAEALEKGLLAPKVAYGWFACRAEGNGLVIFESPDSTEPLARFPFPRQKPGQLDLCLADYFRADRTDVVGFSAVTVGPTISDFTARLFEDDDYSRYLYFHGLGVEAAEGLAEFWHREMRRELGIADDDADAVEGLFRQRYRGARYSFGYPACPDLALQRPLFELIPAADIGLTLTEECQLVPEQSTTALIVHHPEARYYTI